MAIGAFSRLLAPRLRSARHTLGTFTTDITSSSSKSWYPRTGFGGAGPSLQSERHIAILTVGIKYFGGETRPVFNFGPQREKGVSIINKGDAVPFSYPPRPEDVDLLHQFLDKSTKLVVLTGAGISTGSGVPDYRGPNGLFSSQFKPVTHKEFLRSSKVRRRFWARSFIGWKEFTAYKPNVGHTALASLERAGRVNYMVTLNYDKLHHRAGSNPLELHGSMYNVICTGCGHLFSRDIFQYRLKEFNPKWAATISDSDNTRVIQRRQGGGLEIDVNFWAEEFHVPNCEKCSGVLKPDYLFLGDDVPNEKYEKAMEAAKQCDSFLVLGSSLMNASASTLVRAAHDAGAATAIVNIGKTAADSFVPLKLHARVGEILPQVLEKEALST